MTLAWHVPMMLWDHLDLVPMYLDWKSHGWGGTDLWSVHGGSHLHAAAYYVLLATTAVSQGRPWLDCLVSYGLLIGFAVCVLGMARTTWLQGKSSRWAWFAAVFLALTPAHLPNLQWGWQVAVFLCLLGTAIAIRALTARQLDAVRNGVAIAGALLACISFSTGFALLPVALGLIVLRVDLSWRQKTVQMLPWIALFALVVWRLGGLAAGEWASPGQLAHYALNFLGGGVARFAEDAAPFITALALLALLPLCWVGRSRREALPWLAFMAFAIGSAVLTAIGRAAPYGPDHAFVTRYASFSTLFWMGWLGLFWSVRAELGASMQRWLRVFAMALTVLLVINGLHLAKKAEKVGRETRQIASQVRETWPNVEEPVLREIYFERPDLARQRLGALRAWGFAPFAPEQAEPGAVPKQDPLP